MTAAITRRMELDDTTVPGPRGRPKRRGPMQPLAARRSHAPRIDGTRPDAAPEAGNGASATPPLKRRSSRTEQAGGGRTVRRVPLRVLLLGAWLMAPACGSGDPPTAEAPRHHRYRLAKPAQVELQPPTPSEDAWRASLVRNIHHRGEVRTFLRSDGLLLDEERVREGVVFVNPENREECRVQTSNPVVVDFGQRQIGTSGTDGVSFHPHPAGRMIVVLIPTRGTGILGVTLSNTSKCGSDRFVFRGSEATWDW